MGLFDRWFGKKPVPLPADKDEGAEGHDDDDELDTPDNEDAYAEGDLVKWVQSDEGAPRWCGCRPIVHRPTPLQHTTNRAP